jgi:UDP-2,4-diacetamido-2,4,6-trideoxy-beta-L-altropyranose hydrolase
MVIDDIADRQHDCDMLLDQNFYADMQTRYTGKVPAGCKMLLGPRYALLREEFRTLRERTRPRTGPVKKILVFFGGVDSDNYTGLAIEVLSELKKPDIQVDVVIGAQHPCRSAIENNCALQGFLCHVQTTRMAELMLAADLAIGAGGSATWERCAMGVPSIIMVLADNQSKAANDLDCAGVLISLGDAHLIDKPALKQAISQLIDNEQLREDLSLASLALVKISEQNELAEMLVENNV